MLCGGKRQPLTPTRMTHRHAPTTGGGVNAGSSTTQAEAAQSDIPSCRPGDTRPSTRRARGPGGAWMKCTPRWYADAAKPVMSPITPPPSATNVVLRSRRASSALSNTWRAAPIPVTGQQTSACWQQADSLRRPHWCRPSQLNLAALTARSCACTSAVPAAERKRGLSGLLQLNTPACWTRGPANLHQHLCRLVLLAVRQHDVLHLDALRPALQRGPTPAVPSATSLDPPPQLASQALKSWLCATPACGHSQCVVRCGMQGGNQQRLTACTLPRCRGSMCASGSARPSRLSEPGCGPPVQVQRPHRLVGDYEGALPRHVAP